MEFVVFAICAAAIAAVGPRLVDAVDLIGEHTGAGRVWLGTVLLAGATSLPELVSTVSASQIGDPDIAVGTVLGSNMFNMTIFAGIVLAFPRALQPDPAGFRAGLAAIALGILILAFLLIDTPAFGRVGLGPLVLIAGYVVASNALYLLERGRTRSTTEHVVRVTEGPHHVAVPLAPPVAGDPAGMITIVEPAGSLRRAAVLLVISAAIIFVASVVLSRAADDIAETLNVTGGVVGVVGVAFATSLPEVVTSLAALRRGASALVVGNVFGSNLFNVAVIFPSDLAFSGGGLLRAAQGEQAVTAAFGLALMAVAAVTLRRAYPSMVLRLASASILLGYLAGVGTAVALGAETG